MFSYLLAGLFVNFFGVGKSIGWKMLVEELVEFRLMFFEHAKALSVVFRDSAILREEDVVGNGK
jgi:hypothetical protein